MIALIASSSSSPVVCNKPGSDSHSMHVSKGVRPLEERRNKVGKPAR